MTLNDFISNYKSDGVVRIDNYCKDWTKDQILTADWYKEVKSKTVEWWMTFGLRDCGVCIFIKLS